MKISKLIITLILSLGVTVAVVANDKEAKK